jgi:hypothetical protein
MTVNPSPAITGYPGPICTGNTYTLTGTPAGGTWTSSNTAVATVDTNTGLVTGTLVAGSGAVAFITYTSPLAGHRLQGHYNNIGQPAAGTNHPSW